MKRSLTLHDRGLREAIENRAVERAKWNMNEAALGARGRRYGEVGCGETGGWGERESEGRERRRRKAEEGVSEW